MDKLLTGYRRFRGKGWPEQRELFESLAADGQRPKALVLACVDSRVDPGRIFDAAPGEMLTVRNVANLVPPYAPDAAYHGTSAALEFGVRVLEIPEIIVLGHGSCGGVRALLEGAPQDAQDFIAPWMQIARAARVKALECTDPDDRQQSAEHETVRISLANMMTFPWIAERVASGRLSLYGAWFAIHTGRLELMDAEGEFRAVT